MTAQRTRSALSAPRRRLLALMQRVHFGRIEDLLLHEGEPVFEPAPRVVREIRLGGGDRPRIPSGDFALKASVVDLFDRLSDLGCGRVSCLEIRHGLPQRMIVADECSTGGAA